MPYLEDFADLLLMNLFPVQFLTYGDGATQMRGWEADEVRRIVQRRAPWLTVTTLPASPATPARGCNFVQ